MIKLRAVDQIKYNQVLKDLPKLDSMVAKFLLLREFSDPKKIHSLFFPEKQSLSDPFDFPEMEKVCERLHQAKINQEKVYISGDYDVDGSIATSILYSFFKEEGLDIHCFIPNRFTDGYGMSPQIMEQLKSYGSNVVISVDNGITAFSSADKAKELGMDLIITDHHDPSSHLPDCYAILNPKVEKASKFKYLSGAAVAFYLVRAYNQKYNLNKNLEEFLVLSMISSVADVVPLIDDNRLIVKLGLLLLKKSGNLGVKNLIKKIGLKYEYITATDIGFRIAPYINAAGRLDSADLTLQMLTEKDPKKNMAVVEKIIELNLKRREESDSLYEKLKEQVNPNDKAIILWGEHHLGVIGIVAAKLKEDFKKPAIIISLDKGIGKASCRSVDGINMKSLIDANMHHLISGGGHYMAAGFSIKEENILAFKESVLKYVEDQEKIESVDWVDFEISKEDLSEKFVKSLEVLEPFGAKFEAPRVLYNGKITNIKILKEAHLLIELDYKHSVLLFFTTEIPYKYSDKVKVLGNMSVQNGKIKILAQKIMSQE